MHKDFSEWYRQAGIEPDGELLPKRWAAIEAYQPSKDDAVSLARLFYGLGTINDAFLLAFRDSFQLSDPAFKMRGNDHEMSVLAGAQLIEIIESDKGGLADLASLGLVSAAASNLRALECVRDIPEIAARYLSKESVARGLAKDSNIDKAQNETLVKALAELGVPHTELARELSRLQRQISIVTEESNMLWWLFSEYSRDEGKHWKHFVTSAVALMAGKELADLTKILPGPISALAFLDRVIRCGKARPPATVLVKDAINSVTIAWRKTLASFPLELSDLVPIAKGIQLSLASPQNDEWLPPFAQTTRITANAAIAPHILAYQVFIETLLGQAWKRI